MKRKLVILGMLGFTFMFGCSQMENETVSAGIEGVYYDVIYVEDVYRGEAVTLKHKKTGCYYTYIKGDGYSNSISPTQMFIEKDGASVPYCD